MWRLILCLVPAFSLALTLVAAADDTPRPPLAVLRPVGVPPTTAPVRAAPVPPMAPRRELVVLVGGYQSCACDGTFAALEPRLRESGFDVVRFGTDPRFPYDTYGQVDANALTLRDEIRALAPSYGGVHIVTHSMGGVVADRAFAAGLSHDDGVLTYVALSAPHSSSDAARVLALAHGAGVPRDGTFRDGLLWGGWESDSDAVRDLARARGGAAPVGVVRLDLREASDVLVTPRDAQDPGVTQRTLTHALEGHGGILEDPTALDLTLRTLSERRVPPDERGWLLARAADAGAAGIGILTLAVLCATAAAVCAANVFVRTPMGGPVKLAFDVLSDRLPRPARKRCA